MKHSNNLPSMEELLSNKPINQVLLMGKDNDGVNIYHSNGILPDISKEPRIKIYNP